jgi:hypothetical protein
MMSIPFTQYLLPNGRQRPMTIDMPEDVEKKAHALIERGCHFDIEILRTEEVSMTCECGDEMLACEICENGPQIKEAVRDLVEDAVDNFVPEGEDDADHMEVAT